MKSEFVEAVASWSAFYSAVAGVSATLVGLLFVSLALNPAIMGEGGPSGVRAWAAQTFHNFLMVLVVALVALIPDDTPEAMTITLVIVGITGVIRVARDAQRARADPDPTWQSSKGWTFFVTPGIAYLICLWSAAQAWQGDVNALSWLTAVIFLLTFSAASSAWDLLRVIGTAPKPPPVEGRAEHRS